MHTNNPHHTLLIGYYTVLCTIWKDIVRVSIVLKTRIGREACGVSSNTGFQYNTEQASRPIRVFNTIRTSTIYFHIVHNTV